MQPAASALSLVSSWDHNRQSLPSLVVSVIDPAGWGTAAGFCGWMILPLHTHHPQQQQDRMTYYISAELMDELD